MGILQRIYRKIRYILWRSNDKKRISEITSIGKLGANRIYLLCTPEYLNYGDHLIAVAEKEFLKEKFPSYEVIEITKELLILHFEKVTLEVKESDVIAFTGGGYYGDLYQDMESLIEVILDRYSNNCIMFLPATIYLSQEVHKSSRVYPLFDKLNNLTNAIFCARELNTYGLLKENCTNRNLEIIYTPDIAFYYKFKSNVSTRNRVGICFRRDKEAIVNLDSAYLKVLSNKRVDYFSTVRHNSFLDPSERSVEINKFLDSVASFDIVITDRLHCMIMCYITNTPCIVFDNLTRKISGVYKFIENSASIKLVSSYEDYIEAAEELLPFQHTKVEEFDLENQFSILAERIGDKLNHADGKQ